MSASNTGTQLAARSNGAALAQSLAPDEWTREQVTVLKQTIAKGTNDAQFAQFLQVCRHTKLNPFLGEIACVVRGGEMSIQIPLVGLRAIAHESGVFDGEEGPLFCGKDGVYTDTWLAEELPIAAKYTVWRSDMPRPFIAVVHFKEFARIGQMLWQKIPIHMGGKTAGVHAFRKAFRQEIARRAADVQEIGASLTMNDTEAEPEPARLVDQQTGEILNAEVVPTSVPTTQLAQPVQAEPLVTRVTSGPTPSTPSAQPKASPTEEPAQIEPVVLPGEGARTLAEIWLRDMDQFGVDELLSETLARYVVTCRIAASHGIYGFTRLTVDADEDTIKRAGNTLWRLLPQAVRDEATAALNA